MADLLTAQSDFVIDASNKLNACRLDEALAAVVTCKHWKDIYAAVLDDGEKDGDVVSADAWQASEDENLALRKSLADMESDIESGMDRLQRAIVRGDTSEALDILRELAPSHNFLSPSAEHMLAGKALL